MLLLVLNLNKKILYVVILLVMLLVFYKVMENTIKSMKLVLEFMEVRTLRSRGIVKIINGVIIKNISENLNKLY